MGCFNKQLHFWQRRTALKVAWMVDISRALLGAVRPFRLLLGEITFEKLYCCGVCITVVVHFLSFCHSLFSAAGSAKGETNPFESDTYLKKFPWLVEHLDPTLVRLKCATILTPSQRKKLKEKESTRSKHNEELLDILESGGKDSYHHLILILEDMKGMFPAVAAELKAAL